MIVGSAFGWSAVSDRPMDWAEYQLALQLLAEERVGRHVRAQGVHEDADFAASRSAIRG